MSRGLVVKLMFGNRFVGASRDVWLEMPEQVFEDALYPNIFALNAAYIKSQPEKSVAIARATLLALKKYGLKGTEPSLGNFYQGFTNNFLGDRGERAQQFLADVGLIDCHCMLKDVALALWSTVGNASTQEAMRQLTSDPEIRAAYPQLTAVLARLNIG